MPVTRTTTKRVGGSRRNQFGVTLLDGPAEILRAAAKRRRMAPTSLAAEILEQALADRGAGPQAIAEELAEIRELLLTLKVNQINGTLKLLRLSGLSLAEIKIWRKEHLRK